jgi:hypothetical protein
MPQNAVVQPEAAPPAFEVWQPQSADFEPVCEISLKNGGLLLFVDLGFEVAGSSLGIIEAPSDSGHRVLPAFIQAYGATPLEVYRAFKPHVSHAPRALIEDHARVSQHRPAVSHEPRVLQQPENIPASPLFLPYATLADPAPHSGIVVEACATTESFCARFAARLEAEFGLALPFRGRGRDLQPNKRGITALSTRRVFSVFNSYLPDGRHGGLPLALVVECEWTKDVWIKVPSLPDMVSKGKAVTYFSDSWPLLLRYRVTVTQPVNPNEVFHLEAAW